MRLCRKSKRTRRENPFQWCSTRKRPNLRSRVRSLWGPLHSRTLILLKYCRTSGCVATYWLMRSSQLARQLTLMDFRYFKRLTPQEFIIWNKLKKHEKPDQAPNIYQTIQKFNSVSQMNLIVWIRNIVLTCAKHSLTAWWNLRWYLATNRNLAPLLCLDGFRQRRYHFE